MNHSNQDFPFLNICSNENSAYFSAASHELKAKIIDLGVTCLLYSNKQEYLNEIDSLKLSYKNEIEKLKQNYENQLNQQIIKHETLLSCEKDKHNQEIQNIKNDNTTLNDLQNLVTSLFGRKNLSGVSNIERGDTGENFVKNTIQSFFLDSDIQNSSDSAHCGDLHVAIPSLKLKILVECKNKVKLEKQNDMQKFQNDCKINFQNNSFNCGLFVSCKSDVHIPLKGDFQIDIINNTYVCYISDCFNKPYQIYIVIKLLSYLVNNNNSHTNSNDSLTQQINNLSNIIQNSIKHLEKSIKSSEAAIISQQSSLKSLLLLKDELIKSNTHETFSQFDINNNKLNNAIEFCKSYFSQHNKYPSLQIISTNTGINKSFFRNKNSLTNIIQSIQNF